MIEINNKKKNLYGRIQTAKLLLKNCNNPDEKIALCNYIGNIYEAISLVYDKDLCLKKKDVFGSNKYAKKFSRKLVKLEDEMLEKFIEDKQFHLSYMNQVAYGVERLYPDDVDYKTENYSILSMDDFTDIFYQFMESIYLDKFFDDYLKKSGIYSYSIGLENNTLGSALYNPVNKDADILIGDFVPDVHALTTLAHEMGHVYDLTQFNEDIESYNRYFYQSFNGEVSSKLFERLLIDFMINKDILKEEAQDKLIDLEDDNHNYLLSCYILSLLDDEYIKDAVYQNLDNEDYMKIINTYFSENILEFLEEISGLDIQEEFTYGYGDIISMFLKDSITKNGFSNDLINEFLRTRSGLFNKDFFIENDMGPENYLDLYKKELKLLKK